MLIDLPRFIAAERASWNELEGMLEAMDRDPTRRMTVEQARRFHFLHQKVAADLARLATFASEPELRRYLESLTARSYAEIHETRGAAPRWSFVRWFTRDFPRAFRRHFRAFLLSLVVTLAGAVFGGGAVALDPEAKEAVLPAMFANHLGDPSRRVAEEERPREKNEPRQHATFAGFLMVNNIRVSILTLALGMTFGIGTLLELFYNGVILGLVGVDYILAGHTIFLLGWLMPHGVIEIPAILIAGQAGLMLGKALIGWGTRESLGERLRRIRADLITLIGGVAALLVWAGVIESFLSQHHEPVIPYAAKIAFGTVELVALVWFLGWAGRREETSP